MKNNAFDAAFIGVIDELGHHQYGERLDWLAGYAM
jgi:hypothetical protein